MATFTIFLISFLLLFVSTDAYAVKQYAVEYGSQFPVEVYNGVNPPPSSPQYWSLSQGNVGINTTNNVGIGTTTPGGALTVMNGNVGIGTWNPVQLLEVNGNIKGTGSSITDRTPFSVTYAGTVTPATTGKLSIQRIIAAGNITIAVPTGGTDGANIELWITASGAIRTISFNAGIVVPTSSSFSSPYSLASGKKAKVLLQYDGTLNGGQWELTSFVPGY